MFNKLHKKLKRQRKKNRFSLPLIVATTVTGCLVIFALSIFLWQKIGHSLREREDYKLPLNVTNLTYCNGEKMDLFVPQSDAAVPVVIYIHGGGWKYGSKVGGGFSDFKVLTDKGFAVASINYRLSNVAKFPSQIQDVFCAVRYLRAHEITFKLDGSHIGLVGLSAGANLAVLAATASDQTQFTKGEYADQPNTIQAAVGLSGLYDLTANNFSPATKKNINDLFVGSEDPLDASPSHYLSSGDAPLFIVYGDRDKQVPNNQSINLVAQASKLGITASLLKIKSADHNLNPYFSLTTTPTKTQRLEEITDFLIKNLKQ